MKFRKKPEPPEYVEAEQFLGVEPYPNGVIPVWLDKRDPDKVLCPVRRGYVPGKPAVEGLGVAILYDWLAVKYGDWIVTYADGSHFAFSPDRFEAVYEPVEDEAKPDAP